MVSSSRLFLGLLLGLDSRYIIRKRNQIGGDSADTGTYPSLAIRISSDLSRVLVDLSIHEARFRCTKNDCFVKCIKRTYSCVSCADFPFHCIDVGINLR